MNMLAALFLMVSLSGCTGYLARNMSNEQMDNAARLIEMRQGQGCVCMAATVSPVAGNISAEVVGTLGGVLLMDCAEVCAGLRR